MSSILYNYFQIIFQAIKKRPPDTRKARANIEAAELLNQFRNLDPGRRYQIANRFPAPEFVPACEKPV